MGHDYGVPLKFLSVTPTRDNDAAPGNRLKDKHSRLFHGKTLDEWTMLQLWSSRYLGKAYFVCETAAHAERLKPLADKYDVALYVRPRGMLHRFADTGGAPIAYGVKLALEEEYFPLITTPFVVSPCRPPGFFDMLVEQYAKIAAPGLDYIRSQLWVMGGYESDLAYFEVKENGVAVQMGSEMYLNRNPKVRLSRTQHWMGLTHWWTSYYPIPAARHDLTIEPFMIDIEPWMDLHIDTEDDWEWAEYWFARKILSQGADCYEKYRSTWNA